MRLEIIRCDTCKKEHNTAYTLPPAWVTTIQTKSYQEFDEKAEHHFCSKECLIAWAKEESE